MLKKNVVIEFENMKKIMNDAVQKQISELRKSNEITNNEIEYNKQKIISMNLALKNIVKDIFSLNEHLIAARTTLDQRIELEKEISKLKSIIKRNNKNK